MRPRARILIVDDEVNSRSALRELLAEEGYDVDTAADGRQAADMLEAFRPDVVLTDVRMPHLNGLELMQMVRARQPYPPQVVLMSAHARPTQVDPSRFVGKPIALDVLLSTLSDALQLR
jgi:CheY-like chemotaxis protein